MRDGSGGYGLNDRRLHRRVSGRGRSLLGLRQRLFFRLLRFREPKIAIPVEHKSQSNEQKSQSDDHRPPLFALFETTTRRRIGKQTIIFGNCALKLEHAGT